MVCGASPNGEFPWDQKPVAFPVGATRHLKKAEGVPGPGRVLLVIAHEKSPNSGSQWWSWNQWKSEDLFAFVLWIQMMNAWLEIPKKKVSPWYWELFTAPIFKKKDKHQGFLGFLLQNDFPVLCFLVVYRVNPVQLPCAPDLFGGHKFRLWKGHVNSPSQKGHHPELPGNGNLCPQVFKNNIFMISPSKKTRFSDWIWNLTGLFGSTLRLQDWWKNILFQKPCQPQWMSSHNQKKHSDFVGHVFCS